MEILFLGQAGFLVTDASSRLVIDPYLSDSVAHRYGVRLSRQVPIVTPAAKLTAVDAVLLTHAHLDHTDPGTLAPLHEASPAAALVAPYESRLVLAEAGIEWPAMAPPATWTKISSSFEIRAVPAAHVNLERNQEGEWRYVGYLLRGGGITIYHAGDTIPHPAIFESLAGERIDYALLPVNERNFFRDREGIVGNMTVREAFAMAAEIGARTLIPIHWDMFAPNRVHPEEIELLYRLEPQPFSLDIMRAGAVKLLAAR